MKLENFAGNFVDIEGFDDYMISDLGTVYSKKAKKLLSPVEYSSGHLMVGLYLNGKVTRKYVHQLVAEAFIEKPSKEHNDIHHINRCKTDNRVENLSWMTHSAHSKLHQNGTKSKISIKCLETGKTYDSLSEAANDLDLRQGNISRHLKGIVSHVKGYHFEKVEDNEI